MNFLLRSTSSSTQQPPAGPPPTAEPPAEPPKAAAASTLEGLIAEDPLMQYPSAEDHVHRSACGSGLENGVGDSRGRFDASDIYRFSDVSEEEGWITIPYKEIPDNWADAPDIHSLRSLDRSFVFPGEQVHILACLSASKQEMEIITPFKVAAVISRNGNRKSPKKQNGHVSDGTATPSGDGGTSADGQFVTQNGESLGKNDIDLQKDVAEGESILRMEDHKRQTEALLQRFEHSHFFVRITEFGEPLWSNKSAIKKILESSEMVEIRKGGKGRSSLNAVIDRGCFDPNVAGGVARNSVKCCSLPNGDIVVLLQVNVVDFLEDPIIEILQFEKHQHRSQLPENNNNSGADEDPCGELLKWLLPLDNSLPPASARSLTPPVSSSPAIGNTAHRSAFSTTSGSQLFSHLRSYSMSSLPPNIASTPAPLKSQSSKPSFDIEAWDSYSLDKPQKGQTGTEELLSFRGVSLERDRFLVRCGLEGIYIPGRRWRRKLEIIQPVEVHSFAADSNTDDLLCVQIKNVAPAHAPDIIVYVDAITIVFEEAGKSASPSSLPIACIEAGNDHSLPNLALRKGEEHSFIVKPASSVGKNQKAFGGRRLLSSLRLPSMNFETKGTASNGDQYAVVVSYRCNYTESRLFFKQPTNWRPRVLRDLMISVASEISGQSRGPHGRAAELPVQVLTLQASNLTSEDLTLTVLAPASFTLPPSVVSLNSTPTSPMSPFLGFSEFTDRVNNEKRGAPLRKVNSMPNSSDILKEKGDIEVRSGSFNEQSTKADVIPNSGLGCTHLWLQSRVPLGCVPAQSTATIKLELLPLTDGIITLDTLQIDIKEKGVTYIPEHSLKINATSSISTVIF